MLGKRRWILLAGLPLAVVAVWLAAGVGPVTDETVAAEPLPGAATMADAESLRAAGNWQEAAEAYLQVAAALGRDRAQALVRAGECYEQLDEPTDALGCYNQLLASDQRSYWAEVAMARKADLSLRQGDSDVAGECIATLEAMFPDSPWTVQARVTKAKMDGADIGAAEAVAAREMQALDAYDSALRIRDTDEQLQAMEAILAAYPDTATATRAYRSKACLLWRKGRNEEAITPWLAVLERTAGAAPKSHIVANARLHLAALYRKMGRYNEADSIYAAMVTDAPGPELAAKAAYCRIAIDFGHMRADRQAGRPVDVQTNALVSRCQAIAADEGAAELERVRARMLPFEILSWGGQRQACIDTAEQFIQIHAETAYTDEVAMAHFFAGWELTRLNRDQDALAHFQEVIRLTAGKESLFLTDSIPRSYYHVWTILRTTGAPKEAIAEVADALLAAFPESGYSRAVRIAQQREQEEAQK